MDGFQHLQVSTERDGRVWILRLDHGKANEMGSAALAEFEQLTEQLEQSTQAMVLITYSERKSSRGNPIFIAGADVTERIGWSPEQVKHHVRWQRSILARLRHAPVFHAVVVDGVALGWGTEYLLVADYRIACDGAVFGLPETGLGIVPGAGGTSELWAQIGIASALKLGMTGERIGADEAQRIGLVEERVTTVQDGLWRARSLADLVIRRSPTAVAAFKRGLLASVGAGTGERAEIEARAYERCVDSGDAAIGRSNFAMINAEGTPPWGPRQTG